MHPRHDDDHGGLHRDLTATGSAMRRRDLLRYAFGAGALALFGCADAGALTGSESAGTNPGSGGSALELATVTGSVAAGLAATLTVAV